MQNMVPDVKKNKYSPLASLRNIFWRRFILRGESGSRLCA